MAGRRLQWRKSGRKPSRRMEQSDCRTTTIGVSRDPTFILSVQERPTLPSQHRGAHLGAFPRSRHEALSRRGLRALRTMGWRRRARQQLDDDCVLADDAVVSQTKRCLILLSSLRSHRDEVSSRHVVSNTHSRSDRNVTTNAIKIPLVMTRLWASSLKNSLACRQKHAFRDRN